MLRKKYSRASLVQTNIAYLKKIEEKSNNIKMGNINIKVTTKIKR